MNRAPGITPRYAAYDTLLRISTRGGFADRLIDRELAKNRLSGPDRGLFAELVFGVLRRQGTLDHIIAHLLDQPIAKLEPQVLILLRLGVYQLLFLDRIPAPAAVNESVNLARRLAPRACGLVNAVLRACLRRKDAIPVPDPASDPVAAMAVRHSHPAWLVASWFGQLGAAEAEQLAEAASRRPALTLRVNTLRTTRDLLLHRLEESGVPAAPCLFSPLGLRVEGQHGITALPGFHDGLWAVQDESSQLAGMLLGPQPGERVLDACAAPGGKALLLAQLMENRGEILATDVSGARLPLIRETAQRLGVTILATAVADLLRPEALPRGGFDRILLDAPCSGLGVIRRNPETKWRLSAADFGRFAATQKAMLCNVSPLLRPGGVLLYATCSTAREENEQVVEDFLSRHPGFVLEDLNVLFPAWRDLFTAEGMYRAWPHRHGMDGFFAARLRKR
jgi:16S rRNA (cytosine967-C5)-methyltransferase